MNGLAKQFLWSMFLILLAQSYLFAVATNKTYNGSDFSDGGNNLTNTDFIISGVAANETVFNMQLDASPEIYGVTSFPLDSSQNGTISVTVDGTNTGSFELSGISFYDYNMGEIASRDVFKNFVIVGNLLSGGTVTSGNSNVHITMSGSTNGLDESDLDLSSFVGQQISSFEIRFLMNAEGASRPDNLTLTGFTIANAQEPAAADTTPPTLSNISHENVTGSSVDFKATSNEDGKIYYSLSDISSSPTVEEVIGHQVEHLYSDGNNIVQANTSTTFNISNLLDPSTTYYYYVMAEDASGNKSGIERRSFTTPSAIDADATLTTASLVSEPVSLASTVDTEGEARDLFDFKITDGGGGDGLSTDVSQIVLHTSGTADFTKVTWRLNGNDTDNVVGVYSAGDNTLTFSGLSISVPDNSNKNYIVSGYYNTPTGLTNNQTYKLSIDGDDDLTVSANGTQMSGSNSAVNNGAGTLVDITATKLKFETLPSNSN